MPLKKFICPDGEEIEIHQCLAEGGCRMKDRCAARPVLKLMASSDREWKGNPSTTQLLKGTMEAFLMIQHPYATSPDKMAFQVHGSGTHYALEKHGDEHSQAELDLSGDSGSIRPDVLECENGVIVMIDYKITGSFVVAKSLGIYFEDVPVLDPLTNEQLIFKSGARKGQGKTRKEVRRDPKLADVREWALQQNNYRIKLEKECLRGLDGKFYRKEDAPKGSVKFRVHRMKIQAIVRDGGTAMSSSRGIERNIYLIDLPKIPDEQVKEYFKRKRDDLLQAVKQGHWSTPCNDIERWEDRKCQDFCAVKRVCPYWIEKYSKCIDGEIQDNGGSDQIGEDGVPL